MTYRLIILVSILTVLTSCGKDSACFKGTGKVMKEQRIISDEIISIKTTDNIDIVITQSNEASMTLEGGANLLPYINTDISGNELSISNDNKCNLLRNYNTPITLYLSLPDLKRIDYSGQGNVTSANTLNLSSLAIESSSGTGNFNLNLNADNFSIGQHSGPSDFTITGTVNYARVYTLGSGWFFFKDFIAENIELNHSGIGDVVVNATNTLNVSIRSSGNVIYYGNPQVNVGANYGGGNLIQK